jgi:hypothetical protein
MKMDIRTALKEGMKITPMSAYKNKESEPEYTLVKSSDDGELYGFFQKRVIKLSEIDQEKYICTGLDALEEKREYVEIKTSSAKTQLLDHRDNVLWAVEEAIENLFPDDEEWVEIEARKVTRTREEYQKKRHGENSIEFALRGKIKGFYDDATEIEDGVREVF